MIDKNSPDLPEAWQSKNHFDWRVSWLTNQPELSQRTAFDAQIAELNQADVPEEQLAALAKGFAGLEGWFHNFDVTFLRLAKGNPFEEIKKFIVNTNFHGNNPFEFFFDKSKVNQKPPVHVVKQQRKDLIEKVRMALEGGIGHAEQLVAMIQVSEHHAVAVVMQNVAFPDKLTCEFSSAINPLRSLIGRTIKVAKFDPDDEGWVELDQGILEIQNNTIQVGEWSKTFRDDQEISGIAFQEALIDLVDEETYFGFHLPEYEVPDIGLYDDYDY